MKKNLLLSTLIVAAITFSSSLFAQKTADISKVAGCAPTIDGTIDDVWGTVAEIALDVNYPDSDHAIDGDLASDASGYWKALWDDSYLYLLIDITDDEVLTENEADVINEHDDGFDIVFGLADDAMTMLTVNFDESGTAQLNPAKGCCGFTDDAITDMSGGCVESDNGFIMELAVSVTELGWAADAASKFDIRFNDNDAAEEGRDGIISWSLEEIGNWNSSAGWGDVTLKAATVECPTGGTALFSNKAATFNVYPNPASDLIKVSNIESGAQISVLNMIGQEVITSVANDVNIELNVANLVSGVYFVKVGDSAQKVIVE